MRLLVFACTFVLTACGGRIAHPIATESPLDSQLSCAHLSGERENNIRRLEELSGESRDKFSNNVGLLIASPLFLDFSDTQKRETEAIIARNEHLNVLQSERNCAE